jgi:hypothetical protein
VVEYLPSKQALSSKASTTKQEKREETPKGGRNWSSLEFCTIVHLEVLLSELSLDAFLRKEAIFSI